MPRGDRPQAGIVPVPAPGDLTLDAWRPISAAHEQVISPRNFFKVAPPPRGLASSRPRARSRLAFADSAWRTPPAQGDPKDSIQCRQQTVPLRRKTVDIVTASITVYQTLHIFRHFFRP